MRIAVYPGSFDPLTNGHVDIIRRGGRLFDRIVVAILVNRAEDADVHDRRARRDGAGRLRRRSDAWGSRRSTGCWWISPSASRRRAIVRGLRAVSDFEYEFQMALMNRRLNARIETVFMMPAAAVQLHQLPSRERRW